MARQNELAYSRLYNLPEWKVVEEKIRETHGNLMRMLFDVARAREADIGAVKFIAGQVDALEQVLALPHILLKGVTDGQTGFGTEDQE